MTTSNLEIQNEINCEKFESVNHSKLNNISLIFSLISLFLIYQSGGIGITSDLLFGKYFKTKGSESSIYKYTAFQNTIFNYVIFFGAILGCLLSLQKLKIFNKKIHILGAGLIFATGFIITPLAIDTYFLIILSRILIGCGMGLISSCILPFLDDLLIFCNWNKLRIKTIILSGGVWGSLINAGLALLVVNFAFDEKILYYIYGLTVSIAVLFLMAILYKFKSKSEVSTEKFTITYFFRNNLLLISITTLLHLMQQASCINFIFMQSNKIFAKYLKEESSSTLILATKNSLILNGFNLFGIYCYTFIISFLSNFTLQIYCLSSFLTFISLLLISFNIFIPYIFYIYIVFFGFGPGPISWIFPNELATDKNVRSMINVYGSVVNYLASFLIPVIVRCLNDIYEVSIDSIFFIFGSIYFVGVIGCVYLILLLQKRNDRRSLNQ